MKTVEDMARDAGIPKWDDHEPLTVDMLERFAALIRAGEFEACAKVCEGIVALNEYAYADECATAIRARGNT